jgi:putative hemolysin
MSLVSAKELAKAIQLDKPAFLGKFVGWSILKTLRLSKMNAIYDKYKHLSELNFLRSLVSEFKVDYQIEGLENLPQAGSYITVSNHPLGGIDGILLLRIMLEQNASYKILANFILGKIEPLKPHIFAVNPFENHKEAQSSSAGLKEALKHLKEGKHLGIFPAGEVSTLKEGKIWTDKSWENSSMKLIKRAKVPVIPVYFEASNSWLFYKLSAVSDTLRTALLPREMLKQKNRKIIVRIGKAIDLEEQNQHTDLEDYTSFLRKKTYTLQP